jgi:hypothetical protein
MSLFELAIYVVSNPAAMICLVSGLLAAGLMGLRVAGSVKKHQR